MVKLSIYLKRRVFIMEMVSLIFTEKITIKIILLFAAVVISTLSIIKKTKTTVTYQFTSLISTTKNSEIYNEFDNKQEAHGPQLAHLSETATADMQMACNIFPILL